MSRDPERKWVWGPVAALFVEAFSRCLGPGLVRYTVRE